MIRRFLITVLILLCYSYLSAQEVYYYGVNSRPVDSEQEAEFFKTLHSKSEKKFIVNSQLKTNNGWRNVQRQKIRINRDGVLKLVTKEDKLFSKVFFREINSVKPGLYSFEERSKRGKKIRTGTSSTFLPIHLEGEITEFHPNGRVKSISNFKNNQLVSNRNWLPDGSKYIDSVFYSTDKKPVFMPGAANFNNSILKYMADSKINLDEYDDDVVIGWVVMETGVIDGVIALQGRSEELNQLLSDAIAQVPGEWQPAILNGEPVRYFMTIPLTITHNDTKFQDLEYKWGYLHYNQY
ncbi:hypothetical protein ACFLT1_09645 [Bacteroidota bacterium]